MGRAVLQYSHCTSDTARRLGTRGAQGARDTQGAGRSLHAGSGASGHVGRASARAGERHGGWAHSTGAERVAWACCWAAGCALGALSLFLTRFDSVLFLSQILDIVREPGS